MCPAVATHAEVLLEAQPGDWRAVAREARPWIHGEDRVELLLPKVARDAILAEGFDTVVASHKIAAHAAPAALQLVAILCGVRVSDGAGAHEGGGGGTRVRGAHGARSARRARHARRTAHGARHAAHGKQRAACCAWRMARARRTSSTSNSRVLRLWQLSHSSVENRGCSTGSPVGQQPHARVCAAQALQGSVRPQSFSSALAFAFVGFERVRLGLAGMAGERWRGGVRARKCCVLQKKRESFRQRSLFCFFQLGVFFNCRSRSG